MVLHVKYLPQCLAHGKRSVLVIITTTTSNVGLLQQDYGWDSFSQNRARGYTLLIRFQLCKDVWRLLGIGDITDSCLPFFF